MAYKPPLPDFHPSIQKVGAIVSTRWNGKAYRPLHMTSLENYYIDTALDNDADTWSMTLGDPDGLYKALLLRDNEIRVHIYGAGHEGLSPILTGIDDDVQYQDGSFVLTGRDLSSLAVDSTPMPKRWQKARAWSIVKSQAHDLGFHKTQLSRTGMVKKVQYTDGSESYWDFWYRLFRQEKMWLWTLPDGTLVGSKLNYKADPIYYIGDPKASDGAHILNRIIPVESVVLNKTTQGRVWEVVVYGSRGHQGQGANGQIGFNVTVKDPTLHKWQKRPRKVMLDTTARTPNAARKAAWEEIYEGKVGAVEFKVTIPDPGFIIRPNNIARLNLKEIDLHGDYFVVGTRVQGGPDGFVQEIRLREKGMALSKRVPTAPKLNTGGSGGSASASVGSALEQAGIPQGWGNFFVKAAKKYHNPMDYSLFLACLLGICHVETNFHNIRENGGPGADHVEWYQFTTNPNDPEPGAPGRTGGPRDTSSRTDWERQFANEPGVYGISRQFGVGPMQLTSIGIKHAADDMMRSGFRNQYEGGRWHPEFNIMAGARTLHNDVQGVHALRDEDIWIAVMAYNMGVAGAVSYYGQHKQLNSYAQAVKKAVLKDPGYLSMVQSAEQAAQQQSHAQKDGWTSPAEQSTGSYKGAPTAQQIQQFFNFSFNPHFSTPALKRKAIQYAAFWGLYHKAAINYQQHRPMTDMAPPPNVTNDADCSQFATWCYKAAGAPDPNGAGYNGSGSTYTMFPRGKKITVGQLKEGDLVFYKSPAHVAVYVGQGMVIELGSDPGPLLMPIRYRSDIQGFRSYL